MCGGGVVDDPSPSSKVESRDCERVCVCVKQQ
jgi:hypothetical protein